MTLTCTFCHEDIVQARLFDTWAATQDWDEQSEIGEWTHLGRGTVCSTQEYHKATP